MFALKPGVDHVPLHSAGEPTSPKLPPAAIANSALTLRFLA